MSQLRHGCDSSLPGDTGLNELLIYISYKCKLTVRFYSNLPNCSGSFVGPKLTVTGGLLHIYIYLISLEEAIMASFYIKPHEYSKMGGHKS